MNKLVIILAVMKAIGFDMAYTVDQPPVAETYEAPSELYETPTETYETPTEYTNTGAVLTKEAGMINGPTGIETYYNLPMEEHIAWIREITGLNYSTWVRDDGVKMFGDYVMVAANLDHYPYGTIVQTSLGTGIVVDTGGFANWDGGWNWLDLATCWE